MPDIWGLASIVAKFAIYIGVFTSVGTAFAAMLFQVKNHHRIAFWFAVLGAAATLVGFGLAGAMLTGDVSGMTDPEMLGLLWSTPVGTAVALRLAGLGLLIAGLFAGRFGVIVSLLGGSFALWSFVIVGHIPDRASAVLDFILVFHLAAVSLWIGILSPLHALSKDANSLTDAIALGHRFGRMAAIFVPLLILAGGYMSFALVGSVSALFTTSYGQTLMLKVLGVAVLLAFAAANKLRFIPRMAAGDQAAAGHLARSIVFEWVIIAQVLFATAVLTSVLTLPT